MLWAVLRFCLALLCTSWRALRPIWSRSAAMSTCVCCRPTLCPPACPPPTHNAAPRIHAFMASFTDARDSGEPAWPITCFTLSMVSASLLLPAVGGTASSRTATAKLRPATSLQSPPPPPLAVCLGAGLLCAVPMNPACSCSCFYRLPPAGPVLITHFTLLLGMAAPVWLSNALLPGTLGAAAGGTATGEPGLQGQRQAVWLAGYSGIMILGEARAVVLCAHHLCNTTCCLAATCAASHCACSTPDSPDRSCCLTPPPPGFGDTAASAVGSLLGRRPICRGSKKTVEGTGAAAVAALAAWWLLAAALSTGSSGSSALGIASWPALAAATVLSCLLEAATTQLDNIFMPLHYFALLCLL